MIYFDNAASTQPSEAVTQYMAEAMRRLYVNPHATHRAAEEARREIQAAERKILACAQADLAQTKVLWTSGGTESSNTALFGIGLKEGDEVITSVFEHPSILRPLEALAEQGVVVHKVGIDSRGQLKYEDFDAYLNTKTKLVTVTALQNELGTINDLRLIRQKMTALAPKALFHVDNVQGFGKLSLNFKRLKIDMMSVSGHKFHGPHSSGALIYRRGLTLSPLLVGGGQQEGLRSGTSDAAMIATLAHAAELNKQAKEKATEHVLKMNAYCRKGLSNLEGRKGHKVAVEFFSVEENSPYILMFALPGYEGAIVMRFLSNEGVFVGTGSACSAETKEPNKTLTAMGADRTLAFAALRLSFSAQSTIEELDTFFDKIQQVLLDY